MITTVVLPPNMGAIRAFLKAHLKMMSLGMKNSRLSGRHLLEQVSLHTGKTYKRGQYDLAIRDLEALET
jgi:hypothetical protein